MKQLLTPALLALLACTACSGSSTQPTTPTQEKDVDPRYHKLPRPSSAPNWVPPRAQVFSLSNSLKVWHLEREDTELVSIHLVLPTGSSSDPSGKEGLTALTADLLDEGAGKRSALELSDELGLLATDYNVQVGLDSVLLSMDALAENFDASLELLADIIRRPQLDTAEFERRRDHHIAQAIARSSNPSNALSEAYHRVLFGNGYAGSLSEGSKASLSQIRLEDVKARAKQLSQAGNAHLIVVGGIDREELSEQVEAVFGDWKGLFKPVKPKLEAARGVGQAHIVPFEGAAQSALAIVTRTGDANDPKYFEELVMNRPLGEAFTSRINMNLREEKGYTYGAFSTFRRYKHAGFFGVVTNVRTDVTAASVEEVFKELSALCKDRPVTEQEHQEAIDGLLLGYPLRFERVDEIGRQFVQLPVYDRSDDFWQLWPEKVRSVSREQAKSAARPYCDPSKYSVVIAGDPKAIRTEIEKLGLTVNELPRKSEEP